MDNNILLETTVKSFENGIEEVKNVKKSIVKLSDVIKDLLEFNDIFNLDIDSIKLDEVQNVIDEIISEQKNLSKQYKNSINKLKKSQENDLDKISQSMDGFLIETEKISDKIKNMSQNININKIKDISKQADKFLENIKNQYAEFDLEVKKITELGEGIENLKQTVEEINEKVKNEDIEEKVSSAQSIITEFEFNYHKLNKKYGKLNEDIYNHGTKTVEDLKESIGELNNTADEFHNKLLSIGKDLENEELENKYKAADVMIGKVYTQIESNYKEIQDEYKKVQKIPISLKEFDESIAELKNNLNKDELQENTENILNILESFKAETYEKSTKYFEQNKSMYEQSINNIKEIQDAIVQVENQISEFQTNVSNLYNIMSSEKFLDAASQVNKKMEDLNTQCSKISNNFENLSKIDIYENNIIEEVRQNRDATKSIEERMASLEEKMIFLIDENQNLKKLYSQKDNLDDNFKNKILYIINQNLKNVGNNNYNEENTEDKHELAMNYLKRYDENEDLKKAIELFEISSEQGNNESSFNLAEIYYYGRGVEKDFTLALKYYLKAANNGHTKSAHKVIKIYEGKANIGELEYSRLLGDIYLKGKMVKKDIQKAIKWYEVSAESGSKDTVGILIALYELLANQNDVNAKLRLGEIYNSDKWGNKDNLKAFKLYESAEKQGHFEVKNRAGQVACEIGEEMLYSDVNHAIEWYKIAAGKGNAEAQYKLGDIYHKGKIVPKDEEKAIVYYQMAADQGHLLALTQIKIIKPFSKLFK
ncbi:tetratricopeptide repeat protein [Clostridium saccharobutylicum]|uniref:Putative beta-lactamase HcpC n=1 Tax=Clostridium saccharobutylicum TaxID=169679 RepID=A0A1S8NDF8_CLOSA|nr:SEL1-like repeat protein [Clostridium saccharobutylicum]OOM14515.1 putative beta-lactamase HcpC precursor [Clostridium saccharobutylicum]